MKIENGDVILFQGDSITDAGRNRGAEGTANHVQGLGWGYAHYVAANLLADRPEDDLKIYNRGISGHKVFQLAERWQKDCLDLKPSVLSIMIGVNDYWHTLDPNNPYTGDARKYEDDLHTLLDGTRAELPEIDIVICEPFYLMCGAVNDTWVEPMGELQAAAKRQADIFSAVWVPFQNMFDDAVAGDVKPQYWAGDGVHPTMAGHMLMAKNWLAAVNA